MGRDMSILVTGGAGYIGSHMVLALTDRDEKVVVLDNLSTGFEWAIDHRATFVQGEISDCGLLDQIIQDHDVTAIVHFAGSIVVPESVSDPLQYYRNNTVNSRVLLEEAVAHNIKHFIFSSTAAVYGMAGDRPVDEDARLHPMSPYGRSKLMTEWMLEDVTKAHDLEFVALRYFNVAGADRQGRSGQSTPQATHLIKVACQAALGQREKMDIFGTDFDTPDGSCVRDYIHVSDLIAAHMKALDYLQAGGQSQIFNCGYGTGHSVIEVVEAVKRVSGVDFVAQPTGRRAGDPAMIVAKSDKIRTHLGWQPQFDDLDGIISDALKWENHLSKRNAMSRS